VVERIGPATVDDVNRQLDRAAPEPLHDQISSAFRKFIVSGRWPPHTRLPSEPELASTLNVARGTVRRAIRTLTEDGLLIQHQGRGTFVSPPQLSQTFAQEIISSAEALDREGIRYETSVLDQALEPASDRIATQLQLGSNDRVVAIRRVRSVDGAPMYALDNYVVAHRCPGLEATDLTTRPLFTVLEEDYHVVVDGIQRTFQAQIATPVVGELLRIEPGSPVLYLEQVSYDEASRPIEYSDVWIRGDRLRLSAWLRR
jgi:GntR family transcriptional regulator